MNTLRKLLTIAGLGVLSWSLSLVWPELDFMVVLAVVVATVLLTGSIGLVLLWRRLNLDEDQASQPRSQHPSRPIAVH